MPDLVTSKMLVAWLEIRDVKMLRMRSGVPKREYRRSRVLCSLCGSHEHLAFLIGWTIVEGKDLHQNRILCFIWPENQVEEQQRMK